MLSLSSCRPRPGFLEVSWSVDVVKDLFFYGNGREGEECEVLFVGRFLLVCIFLNPRKVCGWRWVRRNQENNPRRRGILFLFFPIKIFNLHT